MTDMGDGQASEIEVLIVGAGPVGLFLANLLGFAGLRCTLIERQANAVIPSMAIGIMPPSLRRLAAIGVADEVVAAGCRVTGAVVQDEVRVLGRLDLSALPLPFPFILSLPQGDLMRLLRKRLAAWPTVSFGQDLELTAVRQESDAVEACVRRTDAAEEACIRARFLAACDGHDSTVRRILDVPFSSHRYPPGFVMGDFPDGTDWGTDAHLFFTHKGAIESFPLPSMRRRWVALCERGSSRRDPAYLVERVQDITGIRLHLSDMLWQSSFRPSRLLCDHFFEGRIALCGDAAHVMSPIGGQGMNTGLADAWHLCSVFVECLRNGAAHAPLLSDYQTSRRRAARIATGRAARGMWIGTRTGRWSSHLRSLFIRQVLFRRPLINRLAPYFAMLTIPDSRPGAADLLKGSGSS